jgi:TatD DNase family protein
MDKYFDTHSHANFSAYGTEIPQVVQRALDACVWMANIGTGLETSQSAVDLASKYPQGVYAAIGLHPGHTWQDMEDPDENGIHKKENFNEPEFEKLLNPKVVAVGEIGLDYFRLPEDSADAKKIQKENLVQQLAFAKKHNLPVMIHCRDAYEDLLDIFNAEYSGPGIIHSYTGDWDMAKKFLDKGFYMALNGILLFDKTGRLKEVCKNLPADRILSETDSPYLAPPPFRGKRNEPLYVKYVVERMAQDRGVSVAEMAQQTFNNALKIFNIQA